MGGEFPYLVHHSATVILVEALPQAGMVDASVHFEDAPEGDVAVVLRVGQEPGRTAAQRRAYGLTCLLLRTRNPRVRKLFSALRAAQAQGKGHAGSGPLPATAPAGSGKAAAVVSASCKAIARRYSFTRRSL